MYDIKTVEDERELKRVFNFLTSLFYDDALEHGEHYYTMSERYEEMKKTLEVDNEFLIYIEDDDTIIAALTGKGLDFEKQKITTGI